MNQDHERDMWQFLSLMVWSIGEILPEDATQQPMTLARAVELTCRAYGDMALPLLDLQVTVH